ncbi:MAG TPA: hypothetical protein VIU12_29170 [Chryseolinea sp.]
MTLTKQDLSHAKNFIEFNLKVNAHTRNKEALQKIKKENPGAVLYHKATSAHAKSNKPVIFDECLEIELDLNPYGRIFDKGEPILKPKELKAFFQYMISFVDRLEKIKKKDARAITKVSFKQNSPATFNISYATSLNGDMPPPKIKKAL